MFTNTALLKLTYELISQREQERRKESEKDKEKVSTFSLLLLQTKLFRHHQLLSFLMLEFVCQLWRTEKRGEHRIQNCRREARTTDTSPGNGCIANDDVKIRRFNPMSVFYRQDKTMSTCTTTAVEEASRNNFSSCMKITMAITTIPYDTYRK